MQAIHRRGLTSAILNHFLSIFTWQFFILGFEFVYERGTRRSVTVVWSLRSFIFCSSVKPRLRTWSRKKGLLHLVVTTLPHQQQMSQSSRGWRAALYVPYGVSVGRSVCIPRPISVVATDGEYRSTVLQCKYHQNGHHADNEHRHKDTTRESTHFFIEDRFRFEVPWE